MTTIAYRDGVLAADTQISQNDRIIGHAIKIRRLPDGSLLGFAGDTSVGQKLLQVEDHAQALHFQFDKDAGDGILVSPTGEVHHLEYNGHCQVTGDYFATGSGWQIALGAMAAGLTARGAVELAIKHDVYSGGDITVLELGHINIRGARFWGRSVA